MMKSKMIRHYKLHIQWAPIQKSNKSRQYKRSFKLLLIKQPMGKIVHRLRSDWMKRSSKNITKLITIRNIIDITLTHYKTKIFIIWLFFILQNIPTLHKPCIKQTRKKKTKLQFAITHRHTHIQNNYKYKNKTKAWLHKVNSNKHSFNTDKKHKCNKHTITFIIEFLVFSFLLLYKTKQNKIIVNRHTKTKKLKIKKKN